MELKEQILRLNALLDVIENYQDSKGQAEIILHNYDVETLDAVLESLNRLKDLEK